MATIAAFARAHAFKLVSELPPLDELTYNRKLADTWDTIVIDLDLLLCNRYTARKHRRALEQLLAQRPMRQAAVQDFLDTYVPNWKKYVRMAIRQRYSIWRERMLETVEAETKDA